MSNVLAIAAVTQILKDLLNDALIQGDASKALGADFTVTALPPDRIVAKEASEQGTHLNLFLHRITPNAALRNADLPTRSGDGALVTRPRLALDLHYILTAVAAEELHAEILLGYAMQLFHETAILPREQIRAALELSGMDRILPQDFDLLRASDIADQIELLKITPHTLSMDDMSKMWTALQANYRTTVAYDVSLVLIERALPTRPSLPVLSRGGPVDAATGRDPGVILRPDLMAGVPTLTGIAPRDGQQVMRLGGEVRLTGHALAGGEARVRFTRPGSAEVLELAPLAPSTPHRVTFRLPGGAPLAPADPAAGSAADPGAWRIGTYTVELVIRDEDGRESTSNALAIALAPRSTPAVAADPGGVRLTMSAEPPIRPGQSVAILLGRQMQLLDSPASPVSEAEAVFAGLRPGAKLAARLRVDGIDSPVIDMASDPPSLVTVTVP